MCSLPIRALAGAVLLSTTAAAQDFNVDFSSEPADVVPNGFAAAGLPGVWNGVNPLPGGPSVALVDTTGAPTTARVSKPAFSGGLSLDSDPTLPTNENLLFMDGWIGGDLGNQLDIAGLRPGEYDVRVYLIVPNHPSWLTMLSGPFGTFLVGGIWTGSYKEGLTHARGRFDLASGNFSLFWAKDLCCGAYGWLSGLQIERVWKDLGGQTIGVNGAPKLALSGLLQPSTPLSLSLSNAAPSALGVLLLNVSSSIPVPFLGGTLHAFPVTAQVLLTTDA